MGFPQPGDVSVRGTVAWVSYSAPTGYVGEVNAFASIYGTPPAYGPDLNKFQFQSATELHAGQQVTFDINNGVHCAIATNVQPA